MDRAALEAAWVDGRCGHATTVMSLHGLCATLSCADCGLRMLFLLRFGRPKTFEVFMHDGAERPVGRAFARDAGRFVFTAATSARMPEPGAHPEGKHPERDQNLVAILMDVLVRSEGRAEPGPAVDFAVPWRGTGCRHESTVCHAYSDSIYLDCTDCAATLLFKVHGADAFEVFMARLPLPSAEYGLHGAGAVIDTIREFADTLDLPDKMADRMSEDPDRDARNMASLVAALERGGLLSRRETDRSGTYNAMSRAMSAALHTRKEFAASARATAAAMRSKGENFQEDGGAVGVRRGLEALWLSWPFWFEGTGVEIDSYDPDGHSEYCARCGFSTLDEPGVGQDSWRRGCPECGYAGYLLDMDGGRKGRGGAPSLGSP